MFEHISSLRKNEFFEFKLEFKDEFSEFWIDYTKYFRFYDVHVSLNNQPSNSNFIEFEI